MHSLLSLPREIRDQIIENVILYRKEPPYDPAHDVQSRQDPVEQGGLRPPLVSSKIYNATGLLGTNAQLRDETQNRLDQLRPTYSLDVMVVDNELWPTWTCCPCRASRPVDEIKVSLRFFSKPNDPYMVHVARTCWAILQGRKWTNTSLHPLAEIFLHVRDICLHPGSKDMNMIKNISFDAAAADRLDTAVLLVPSEPLSNIGLKSLFGKHRSLWNSFRSVHQYPFAGKGGTKKLELTNSLKIMVLLYLQEAWEDECAIYATYVGPLGSAFRSVQDVHFAIDGKSLGQLTSVVPPA